MTNSASKLSRISTEQVAVIWLVCLRRSFGTFTVDDQSWNASFLRASGLRVIFEENVICRQWRNRRTEPSIVEEGPLGVCKVQQTRGVLPRLQPFGCTRSASSWMERRRCFEGRFGGTVSYPQESPWRWLSWDCEIENVAIEYTQFLWTIRLEARIMISLPIQMMIYLIEGVLPNGYFTNDLQGLSVDMAVSRDLLRLRLSALAKHLDRLQAEANDASTGISSYVSLRTSIIIGSVELSHIRKNHPDGDWAGTAKLKTLRSHTHSSHTQTDCRVKSSKTLGVEDRFPQ